MVVLSIENFSDDIGNPLVRRLQAFRTLTELQKQADAYLAGK